jgi:general secretion pathway protein I
VPTDTLVDRQRAFTLIEVLVAVVVVSMGTLAIAGQIGQSARNARLIQAKTLGTWIAMNKITELRLVEGVPDAGRDDGEIEFAGRDWVWESEIKSPSGDVENFMRIEVNVALANEPDEIIADAIGFIGRGGNAATARPFDTRAPVNGGTPGPDGPGDDGIDPADPGLTPRSRN